MAGSASNHPGSSNFKSDAASREAGRRRNRHHRETKQATQVQIQGEQASAAPVLYVHPAKQGMEFRAESELGRPYGLIPLGLPAIINRLRQNGIGVEGVNYSMEKELDPAFNLHTWLKAHQGARVILIDLHWYEHCYGAIQTARFCKQSLPEASIILGGLSATGWSREILASHPEVDYIIRGDAELPLLQLVQLLLSSEGPADPQALARIPNLSYRQGEVVESPLGYTACTEDLDTLDFADVQFMAHWREYLVHEYVVTDISLAREALNNHNPYTGRWVCTARGCKYNCSYCGGSRTAHKLLANRSGLIIRSPERVAEEVRQLEQMGVTQVSFSWDIAELGKAYWETLFNCLQRNHVKIGLYNEFFQMPDAEFIEAFAANGVREHTCLALNPLVGNERVRRMNGKHYTNEALFDILDVLSRLNMYLFVYFSLNLPGETRETFEETVDLAKEIYDFYPGSLVKILNVTHTIDPVSPMNVNAPRFGLQSKMTTFKDYYEYCRTTGTLDPNSRSGFRRGFDMQGRTTEDLEAMVASWDRARQGREGSWWPVPPGW